MLSIQTDYSTLTAVLGRRAHSHREALSSAAFVADQVAFCAAAALTEKIRWTPFNRRMESGGLHASIEGIRTIHLR